MHLLSWIEVRNTVTKSKQNYVFLKHKKKIFKTPKTKSAFTVAEMH